MGSKDKPGQFDCYANAEPDEPMFVLLGRDKHAPQLVELWAGQRASEGEDPAKVEEALKCAKAMRKWRYDRKGAPTCEYCEAGGGESGCTKESTKLVSENGFLWWYWCGGPETFLATGAGEGTTIMTIDEYFATEEVQNEYCQDEGLRVYHETKAMRARANEAAMNDESNEEVGPIDAKSSIDDVVRLIKRDCPFWAPEVRVHCLLPYLHSYGDPLYDALMALSEDERKGCGVDEIVVKKIGA
jgi:hypothetical protein